MSTECFLMNLLPMMMVQPPVLPPRMTSHSTHPASEVPVSWHNTTYTSAVATINGLSSPAVFTTRGVFNHFTFRTILPKWSRHFLKVSSSTKLIDEQPLSSRPEANCRLPWLDFFLSYFSHLCSPSMRSTSGCSFSGSPISDLDFEGPASLIRSDITSARAASAFALRRLSAIFVISTFSAFECARASAHSLEISFSFIGITTSRSNSRLTWSLISPADALRAASICFLSSSSAAVFFDSSWTERRIASSSSASLFSFSFFSFSFLRTLREMAFASSTASSSLVYVKPGGFGISFFESSMIDS